MESRFNRLFTIISAKEAKVSEMGSWTEEGWSWSLVWRRNLFVWEIEMLDSLLLVLNNTKPQQQKPDRWFWEKEPNVTYSVKNAYSLISKEVVGDKEVFCKLWTKPTPLRIAAFGWKTILNRIPTTVNLQKRGMMGTLLGCPFCNRTQEHTGHLFFYYYFSHCIWMYTYSWFGCDMVLHNDPKESFLNHRGLYKGVGKKIFWQLIWFAAIWALWRHTNDIIFNGGKLDFEKVMFNAWSWASTATNKRYFSYLDWTVNPQLCLK